MAYVPPHKRLLKGKDRASPTPELLVPQFRKNLNFKSNVSNLGRSGMIVYANHAISTWFPVGLAENGQFPSYIHLDPISLEDIERKAGEKPLILVRSHSAAEDTELRQLFPRSPWVIIAENVQQNLLSSFKILRNEMEDQGVEVKPTLVARFGKIVFRGSPSASLASVEKDLVTETILRQLKKSFYTNVPSSYMENIKDKVVPMIGVDFQEEKDVYHVKLSDNSRPDSTVSCKCSVKEDKKLQLYKVELNQVRHMVTDVSCLDKNIDLRLMLCSKRILTALTDDEMDSIRNLINSAVLDSNVKGGLRWQLGKESSGDRYTVVGVWHTISKAYKNKSIRLKVRHADRFDFRNATGEASGEMYIKLKGIVIESLGQNPESNSIRDMLEDNLKLIWEHFFCCERFLM
ncbi:hypothetical protein K2173_026886 [Erythroxylum novogranatense]|uniref:DUF7903 domain-containing protein n=1 Tax=Erythroxylum novogranatense TaxID=1862640 RepID=A0AAV8U090_9ROSI|nr:hypothetical protein K2173_026886 [Erythroxylum novogranatense]